MKVRCTYGSITDGSSTIVEGGIYEVAFDGGVTYIEEPCGGRLYFDLNTGLCSWRGREDISYKWFTFEEVKDQPKYATSPEVLAQVFRKMADNILAGLPPKEGIQQQGEGYVWRAETADTFMIATQGIYRVTPETITLKNGVEIPKPLGSDEILEDVAYYHVDNSELLYNVRDGEFIADHGIRFVYETREEAIVASKALFGLEIKDV